MPPPAVALNAGVQRLHADPEANRLRYATVCAAPQVNGKFSVPVVTLHTLGDLFVPFRCYGANRRPPPLPPAASWCSAPSAASTTSPSPMR